MKAFKIRVEPYGRKLWVVIGGDTKDVLRLLKKEGISKKERRKVDLSDCDGYTYMFDGLFTLLWLQKAPNNPYRKGILAHEIGHTVDFIMSYCNVTRDNDANEAFMYLTGWITQEIYKKLK